MALARSGLIRFSRWGASTPSPAEVLAALPAPALLVDPAGAIVLANNAAESLLNQSQAALAGRDHLQVLGIARSPGEPPYALYDALLSLGGRPVRADVMAASLPDQAGWRIVTLHRRQSPSFAERRSSKLSASHAAATLAHEIKNPLSGIRGAAQLLDGLDRAEGAELTRLIRDEVDRIAALIDRMEGFTDTRPLALEPQNIHAILGHSRDVARQGFARELVIREIYDPSLPAVLGHRDALVQIVINLIKNAAEAGSGTITLTTAYRHGISVAGEDGRRPLPIEVCVIDDGPGAPPAIAANLFDPFVTSKPSGGGLGLALVDKLVADQGGVVEYGREGDPPRTVLRLLLPRA